MWCGTHEPRKNLAALLRAFGMLVADGTTSAAAGRPRGLGSGGGPAAAVAARVRTTGFLAAPGLHAAYAGAAAFAYPSLREGFGMPVLEAMAHGVPVVTTRGSAMAETASGAGVLVEPTDPAAVAAGVLDVPGAGRELRASGRGRAAGSTWAAAAARLREVYGVAARTA